MPRTSDNTAFTRRAAPSGRPLVARGNFEEADSGDNPAPTNRVAAAPSGLKSVRVRECGNVIGNSGESQDESRAEEKMITMIKPLDYYNDKPC